MSMEQHKREAWEEACPKGKTAEISGGISILELSHVFSKCNKTRKQTQRQVERDLRKSRSTRKERGVTVLNADNIFLLTRMIIYKSILLADDVYRIS